MQLRQIEMCATMCMAACPLPSHRGQLAVSRPQPNSQHLAFLLLLLCSATIWFLCVSNSSSTVPTHPQDLGGLLDSLPGEVVERSLKAWVDIARRLLARHSGYEAGLEDGGATLLLAFHR